MADFKIGTVSHYYAKISVAVLDLRAPLHVGDFIHFGGSTDFSQKRSGVLTKKYRYLEFKFAKYLKKEFIDDNDLYKIFFSIMIMEDLNRTRILRFIEKLFLENVIESLYFKNSEDSKVPLSVELTIKSISRLLFCLYSLKLISLNPSSYPV